MRQIVTYHIRIELFSCVFFFKPFDCYLENHQTGTTSVKVMDGVGQNPESLYFSSLGGLKRSIYTTNVLSVINKNKKN